jgi:hypothetical protein
MSLPDQDFTAEMVHNVLRNVIKGNAKLPSPTDPALVGLAFLVNVLRGRVKWSKTSAAQDSEQYEMIGLAISTLAEMLPTHREHYVSNITSYERWVEDPSFLSLHERTAEHFPDSLRPQDHLEMLRGNLSAFDALVKAAQAARDRGLPIVWDMRLAGVAPGLATRWEDLADDIERAFLQALPGQSKSAAHRFIEAIIPHITGESPSYRAVETRIKRNVNGRKMTS